MYDEEFQKIHSILSENEIESSEAEWSHLSQVQGSWSSRVEAELASVATFDPRPHGSQSVINKQYYNSKTKLWQDYGVQDYQAVVDPPPQELEAGKAIFWTKGSGGVDMRPHVWDPGLKEFLLCDSGSQITACKPDPGDKPVPGFFLKAVNGSKIECYGYKNLDIKIGRKTYPFRAIKANIASNIIGWDFIRHHKLDFVWNDFGDITIRDKKADISVPLVFKAMPHTESREIDKLFVLSSPERIPATQVRPDARFFEVACMMQLAGVEDPDIILEKEDINKIPDSPYKDILKRYPDLLVQSFSEEFTKNGVTHRIRLKEDQVGRPPCRAKVRRLLPGSEKERKAKEAWFQLVKLGIVEQVDASNTNTFTSPLHFAPKPDDTLRPVGDYRLLNKRTELDLYPLPHLKDYTYKVAGSKIFSKVDLRKAFHQVNIDIRDRYLTCVTTPWGLFNFRRLSMGMQNSAQSFQRLMDSILNGLENVFCYMDDLLIYNKNEEEHKATLEELFKRLAKAGLSIATGKCLFGVNSLEFLGYSIDATGIKPVEKKVQALQKFPPPTKQKELLAFLGALNYYRSSLPRLESPPSSPDGPSVSRSPASILDPLYKLATCEIPKKTKFKEIWDTPTIQKAFTEAKLLLQKAITLNYPVPSAPLALSTDASLTSIGAVLEQQVKGI